MPVAIISVIGSNRHLISCNIDQSVDGIGVAVNLKLHRSAIRIKIQHALCGFTVDRTGKGIGNGTCGIAVISTGCCSLCYPVCMQISI